MTSLVRGGPMSPLTVAMANAEAPDVDEESKTAANADAPTPLDTRFAGFNRAGIGRRSARHGGQRPILTLQ
jgi:hypothetical protein